MGGHTPIPIMHGTLDISNSARGYFLATNLFMSLVFSWAHLPLSLSHPFYTLCCPCRGWGIPMGRVHRPEAFSSSSKTVMMGTNFCLLSSVDTKLLSSWMEHGQHGGHTPGPPR